MNTYYTKQGDTLDSICHKYYGTQAEAVEVVLAANNGLADVLITLPINTKIILPDLIIKTPTKNTLLW